MQPKVLKHLPLKSIAEKCDHEPILYAQCKSFLTKQANQEIGEHKGNDKR